MKKVFKFLGTVAAVGAAAVGAVAVYRRFFAPAEDIDDLDDDFDDEFEDEDLDKEPAPVERGYVSIHSASEAKAEEAEKTDGETAKEEKAGEAAEEAVKEEADTEN